MGRLLIIISFVPSLTLAFDPDRCGNLFPMHGNSHRPYFAPIYSTTIVPSVTSYFSSFGPCAMYGNEIRQVYIDSSFEQITMQAASGKGEHLVALAEISGCNQAGSERLPAFLKENYSSLSIRTSKEFAQTLDELMESDELLRKNCRIQDSF